MNKKIMKTTTREKIYIYIASSPSPISVKQIRDKFALSNAMIHRHLKKLLESHKIKKNGTPPKVFYSLVR